MEDENEFEATEAEKSDIVPMPVLTDIEDFTDSMAAFEWVYSFHDNKLTEAKMLEKMSNQARLAGIRNFKHLYKLYVSQVNGTYTYANNYTDFENQPMELATGTWEANNDGIYRTVNGFEELACCHPIMPVERLINIDTGLEKLKIIYCKGRRWREVIAEKKVLASASKIVDLADYGIAVTSENAKPLIRYLSEIENLNYDTIPEKKSFSRLGFFDDEGFIPYVDDLVFDGDLNYKTIFNSITQNGDRNKWLEEIRAVRKYSETAKIIIAASFASPLIKICNAQVFFTHLWSSTSGTGKTVALMAAASVWANPDLGKYIQSFNSTQVGQERLAAFLNQLPMMIDELQLNNGKGFNVYQLSEGVGRSRGNKYGGIDTTPVWSNSILTTGETPILSGSVGAGAVNRVLDIECKSNEKVIEDGQKTTAIIKNNYGFGGREFVEMLYGSDTVVEIVRDYFSKIYKDLCCNDTTEKQAMAAALLVTADGFATDWIFKDGNYLTVDEISKHLATKAEVSLGERGYKYMCDWVSINANRFLRVKNACGEIENGKDMGDIYGILDTDKAYVISSAFRRAAEEGGYNSAALLSYLKEHGLIETRGKATTKCKRIKGTRTECVFLTLPSDEDDEEYNSLDDLDF